MVLDTIYVHKEFLLVLDNLESFEISTKYYLRPFLVIWTVFGNFGLKMESD